MATYGVTDTQLTAIADAIRLKRNTVTPMEVGDMPLQISLIDTGEDILSALIDRTITNIEIPNGTTKIGQNAFSRCTALASVSIPNTVTSIGTGAFMNCSALQTLDIPSSVTVIGNNAFQNIYTRAIINCGFAEGTVEGAPWGAPANATINYGVSL